MEPQPAEARWKFVFCAWDTFPRTVDLESTMKPPANKTVMQARMNYDLRHFQKIKQHSLGTLDEHINSHSTWKWATQTRLFFYHALPRY